VPCTKPIRGTRGADGVVRLLHGVPDSRLFGTGNRPELELPCGRCMDCKIRRSQDWSTRAQHEATLHQKNSFITLTFSDEGLALRELQHGTHPYDLAVQDWQLFAKRLRKQLNYHGLGKLRFFQVGEYGDEQQRPHYHALVFGQDFKETEIDRWKDDAGHPVWTSRIVEKCWPYGFHEIKEMAPEAIAYVCKYVQKKLYGERRKRALERVDSGSGECVTVRDELATMSRKPGIGHDWWKKFKNDAFPDDFVVIQGKKLPVPKYYYQQLEKEDPDLHAQIREERIKSAAGRAADNVPERRLVREKVTLAKTKLSKTRKL